MQYQKSNKKEIDNESIINKIYKKKELYESDFNILESIIYQNNKNYNLNYIYNFIILNALSKRKNVSYECFLRVIKQFVENRIRFFYPNPECIIISNNLLNQNKKISITTAKSFYNKVCISEEAIQELYKNGNNELLNDIFHELTHLEQFKYIFDGESVSNLALIELKDELLSRENIDYYNKNYRKLSFELEARYLAIIKSQHYLESLGFKIEGKIKQEEISQLVLKESGTERIINDKIDSLENIFNDFILNKPNLLNEHAQLNILYKEEDGEVLHKSTEEMKNDLDVILNDINYSNIQKKFFKNLYKDLIKEKEIKLVKKDN